MKRDEIIDICKGIGILLVVLGHLDVPFGKIIYAFHMPLFFYLSGRCFSDRYLDNKISFIKKRFITLLIPVVVFEGGIKFLLSDNAYNSIITPNNIFGTYWFLKALFVISIMYLYSLCLIRRKKWSNYVIPLGYLISTFVLSILISVDSQTIMGKLIHYIYMASFFALGYSDKSLKMLYNETETTVPFKRMGGVILALLIIAYTYKGGVDMGRTSMENYIQYAIGGILGICLTVYVSKFISKSKMCKIFTYFGQYTLSIMLFHFAVFFLIDILIETICVTNVPLYIVKTIKIIGALFIPICVNDTYHYISEIITKKYK